VIPPERNAEFVASMEDVLEVYRRPYDPKRPVVCLDEQPVQLVRETRRPIAVEPGQPARYDYEYERVGTAVNFMLTEPLGGRRKVKAFPPAEARRLLDRLEIHYTPKHGSWLDIAEIELSVFTQQGLDRRIPDLETLRREATAWAERRNAEQASVDWQFTTEDARTKLKRLYPQYKEK